jgi:hypothetical protein
MLRRLFTVLSALSLLLCVATAVLWVRSYQVGDSVFLSGGERIVIVSSASGRLSISLYTVPGRKARRATWDTRRASRDFRARDLHPLPFFRRTGGRWPLVIPWVLPFLLSAPPGAWAARHLLRMFRRSRLHRRGGFPVFPASPRAGSDDAA